MPQLQINKELLHRIQMAKNDCHAKTLVQTVRAICKLEFEEEPPSKPSHEKIEVLIDEETHTLLKNYARDNDTSIIEVFENFLVAFETGN